MNIGIKSINNQELGPSSMPFGLAIPPLSTWVCPSELFSTYHLVIASCDNWLCSLKCRFGRCVSGVTILGPLLPRRPTDTSLTTAWDAQFAMVV
jgi:hypothetical protein